MIEISSTSIINGQTGVSPITPVTIIFSESPSTSSINSGTLYLYNERLEEPVDAILSVAEATVTLTPKIVLEPGVTYSLIIVGKTDNGIDNAGYIYVDKDTNYLATTKYIRFSTGTGVPATVVVVPDGYEDSVSVTNNVVYADAEGDLDIISISPSPFSYGFSVNTNQISILFSEVLAESQNDYVTVTVAPIFNNSNMLVLYTGDNYIFHYNDMTETAYDWTLPTASISFTGSYLNIDLSGNIPYGTVVKVELDKSLSSVGGSLLETDTTYEFVYECLPSYVSVEEVRFSPGADLITNYSNLLLYKAICYWSYYLRRKTNIDVITYAQEAEQFVVCAVINMLLRRKISASSLYGVIRSQTLGDFSISYGDVKGSQGIDGPSIVKETKKCMNNFLRVLKNSYYKYGILSYNSPFAEYYATRLPRKPEYEGKDYYNTKGNFADTYDWSSWGIAAPGESS